MSINPKDIKPKGNNEAEKYISLYKQYKSYYKDEAKLAIFYQLGDFYEIYALEYTKDTANNLMNETKKVGNLWELSRDLNIAIGKKKISVYNDPSIQVYMGGIGVKSIDKYLNISIENGWTIVVYSQQKNSKTGNFVRVFDKIVSPGINLNSTEDSNFTMFICLEKVTSIINPANNHVLYAGIALIDTLTGYIGTIQYPLKEQLYDEVIFDEIIKLITIKNPSNIVIYADKCNMNEKSIVDKLHLNMYHYNIIMDSFPKDFTKLDYQESLFKNLYDYKLEELEENTSHIFDVLGLKQELYSRYALTALFEYIIKRNQAILHRIAKPHFMYNETANLVLQNNSLEQLNIVNNMKKSYHYEKRLSLLTLLDKTKTAIGKRGFRNKLMNPITDIIKLKKDYDNIEQFTQLEEQHQIQVRNILASITDINKSLRKITNYTFKYCDIISFLTSIKKCIVLEDKLTEFDLTIVNPSQQYSRHLKNLIKYIETTFNIDYLNTNMVLSNDLEGNIFNNTICPKLDEIQEELNMNHNLINIIVKKLNIMIDDEFYTKKRDKNGTKSLINKCDNTKFNTYLTTTKKRIELIKAYIDKSQKKYGYAMMIGKNKLMRKDFIFEPFNKTNYRIDVECIRNSGVNLIKLNKILHHETTVYFKTVLDKIYETYHKPLEKYIKFIGDIDIIQSCGVVALENGYVKPIIEEDASKAFIDVKTIRHPIIEKIQTDIQYVGNDICMGRSGKNGILLFGVNAVGKSSLMKSIGCNLIMAQAGMFVPAQFVSLLSF